MRYLIVSISAVLICLSCSEAPAVKETSENSPTKKIDPLEKHTVKTTNEQSKASSEIPYENGLKNGIAKQHYPNGDIWKESPYKDGKLHGEVKIYERGGKLSRTAQYTEGKLDGKCINYFKSGNPKYTATYRNGLIMPGVVEKNYRNETIKPAVITSQFEDRLITDYEYIVHFKLNGKVSDVEFYALREAKDWTSDVDLGIYELRTQNKNEAQMTFKLDPGYFIATDVHLYVTYKTASGNPAVVYKQINVAAENKIY